MRDASRTHSGWLVEWRATYLLASDRARSTKVRYAGLTRSHVDLQIASIPLDNELPAANPVEKVKRPRAFTPEATSLTPEQAGSMLRAAAGLSYAAVLRLILGAGLRRGAALVLRWADVDLVCSDACITGWSRARSRPTGSRHATAAAPSPPAAP